MTTWPQYLKRETVAVFFDTSPQTVDRWVKSGAIPGPRIIAGAKRWNLDELLAAAGDAISRRSGVKSDPDRVLQDIGRDHKNRSQAA